MTFDQIDALTLAGNISVILHRILDSSLIPQGEEMYTIEFGDNFYDSLHVHNVFTKPSLSELEGELHEWKTELAVIEQARLDEEERVNDITSRFEALSDKNGTLQSLGIGNTALELQRIIKEDDTAKLAEFETKDVELKVIRDAEAAEAATDAIIEMVYGARKGCVKIIMKFNILGSLTSQQKDDQKIAFESAFEALKDYRPGKFKSIISGMTPDGTLVTQELKDELLDYLTGIGI